MDRLSKSITTNMTQTGKDLKGVDQLGFTLGRPFFCNYSFCFLMFSQDLRLTAAKDFHNRKITDTEFRMVNNLQSSLTIRSTLHTFNFLLLLIIAIHK